jgi:hypothetical protein
LFGVALAIVATLIGIIPAMRLARQRGWGLRGGGRGFAAGGRTVQLRDILVVSEIGSAAWW